MDRLIRFATCPFRTPWRVPRCAYRVEFISKLQDFSASQTSPELVDLSFMTRLHTSTTMPYFDLSSKIYPTFNSYRPSPLASAPVAVARFVAVDAVFAIESAVVVLSAQIADAMLTFINRRLRAVAAIAPHLEIKFPYSARFHTACWRRACVSQNVRIVHFLIGSTASDTASHESLRICPADGLGKLYALKSFALPAAVAADYLCHKHGHQNDSNFHNKHHRMAHPPSACWRLICCQKRGNIVESTSYTSSFTWQGRDDKIFFVQDSYCPLEVCFLDAKTKNKEV